MAGNDDDLSTLAFTLEPLDGEPTVVDPRATLRPRATDADTAGFRALAAVAEASKPDGGVTLLGTIGQGGMGVVHLAEQLALGRTVAVKRLKPGFDREQHTLALLREAWVTGSLEHPNVVPVYDLGLDDAGRPFLVMKRIEGQHWGDLLRDPWVVRDRFEVADVFAWHIGVLMQVCNALHFAHDRGVLHRDLKPENVMIGAFGEVYLLDWGIAVALGDDRDGRVPLVGDSGAIAGTPAYMAPEMLAGGIAGPRTDVYLLGGLLYELLCGTPPHLGRPLKPTAGAPAHVPPPPHGPSDLVELCLRAMAPTPGDRPPTARAFGRALQRHLERRGAARLASEAGDRLDELLADLAGPDGDADALWRRFGEVRFGFRQALGVWPDHTDALEGLSAAVSAMARWELSRGRPQSAAQLVGEADARVDPDLVGEIEAEVRRVQRALDDRDPARGQRARWAVAVALGAIWTAFPLMSWWFGRESTYESSMRSDGIFTGLVLLLGFLARKSLVKTAFNRRVFGILLLGPISLVLLAFGSKGLGVPMASVLVYQLLVWMMIAALASVTVEWRLWPTTLIYGLGFVVASRYPGTDGLVSGIGNGALTLTLAAIWWPGWRRGPNVRRP